LESQAAMSQDQPPNAAPSGLPSPVPPVPAEVALAEDLPPKILIVEDSTFFALMVKQGVEERIGAEALIVNSMADAKRAVEESDRPFFLSLVDVILPDCSEGEVAELMADYNISCIVFSGIYSDDLRERLLSHKAIDYVVKDSPNSLSYLLDLVDRLYRNQRMRVLIVDDSRIARQYTRDLLESYRFQVLEAVDGREGIAMVEADPEIRLVITDQHMPEMDGVEMVRQLRGSFDADRLAIIGVSSSGSHALSAKFIKYGANDFLVKPFLREEFFCRVVQNVKMLELVDNLKEAATRDFLTGLNNRRFFYDAGGNMFSSMLRGQIELIAAMIDVDFFKKVNDTYGHDGGDVVLQRVAQILRAHCRKTDVVARFGGEEFAILAVNMDHLAIERFFEKLRADIEASIITVGEKSLHVTISIGVCAVPLDSLDAMLEQADQMLYRAKGSGRNRVEVTYEQTLAVPGA